MSVKRESTVHRFVSERKTQVAIEQTRFLNTVFCIVNLMHHQGYCELLQGICPPCQSRGWGICKFCTARGPGICQLPGHSRSFDTHAVSYQNITTQRILLKKNKQIGSFVKDGKKLKRFVKACSRFYACISSLLIKPELHSEIGSYRRESKSFELLNQISLDVI